MRWRGRVVEGVWAHQAGAMGSLASTLLDQSHGRDCSLRARE